MPWPVSITSTTTPFSPCAGDDFEDAARLHRIPRIQKQIQKYLLQLARIAFHRIEMRIEFRAHLDARLLQLMLQKRQRFLNHAIELHFGQFRGRSPREVQQRIDDFTGAERLARNLFENARLLFIFRHLLGQHLRVGGDHRQRRIHLVRDSRGQQSDARQFVGLHQAALQFGAVRNIVEDHQTPDLLVIARHQRRDGDVHAGFAVPCIQREFVEVMDAHLAARALELLDQRGGEKFRQSAAYRIGAPDAAQPLHLRIPAFDPVVETRRENADVNRLDDVLAEFLQALILVHFLFERPVEIGVFGGDADIIRQCLQQFDVVARKKLALLRAADAEESDGPAANRAGQVVVEIQIGNGLAHA